MECCHRQNTEWLRLFFCVSVLTAVLYHLLPKKSSSRSKVPRHILFVVKTNYTDKITMTSPNFCMIFVVQIKVIMTGMTSRFHSVWIAKVELSHVIVCRCTGIYLNYIKDTTKTGTLSLYPIPSSLIIHHIHTSNLASIIRLEVSPSATLSAVPLLSSLKTIHYIAFTVASVRSSLLKTQWISPFNCRLHDGSLGLLFPWHLPFR
jgi:hypothetical protein